MDYHGMKRKELQQLCKKHGVPANLTNLEMANKLSSLLKIEEKSNPIRKTRSCLKICSDVLSENESDLMNKKGKKVRFSPENDVFQFGDKKVEFLELVDVKRGRRKKRSAEDEGGLDVENKGEGGFSRVTRGKALLGQKVTLSSPVVMKKRSKRSVQEDQKRGNAPSLVVDLNGCFVEGSNETVAVKSLRNRKVESVVPAKNNVRKRNARMGSQSVSGEAAEKKDVEVDGGISQAKTGVRRSTRSVKTSIGSEGVNGEMGGNKMIGSRSRRVGSGTQEAVAAGCEIKSEPQFKNDDVPVISRKNLRKKGAKNTTLKCKDDGNESDIKHENVSPPKMTLRRSSRNKEGTEDSGQLVDELPAVDVLNLKNVRSVKGSIHVDETNQKNVRSVKGSIHSDENISETAVPEETGLKVPRKNTRQSAKSSVEDVKKAVTGKLANPEVVPRQSKRKRSELTQVEPVQKILGGTEVAGRRKITRSKNQAQERLRGPKTQLLPLEKGSKIEHVRRSKRNASGDESHVISQDAHGSDVKKSMTKKRVRDTIGENVSSQHSGQHVSRTPNNLPDKLEEVTTVAVESRTRSGIREKAFMHSTEKVEMSTNLGTNRTIGEKASPLQSRELSVVPDCSASRVTRSNTVAVEPRTRSGIQQKSFKHTAKKLRLSGKPSIDEKDSLHRSREHSTTPGHSETESKVRKSQNENKTSLLAASNDANRIASSASRVTRSNSVAEEPQTRSGIRQKSVKHTTKKLRMSGKPGPKISNDEKDSPDKSKGSSIAPGHSETDSEVRRSNNAYEANLLAASSYANQSGSTGTVSTEHVSGVEEYSKQFTDSAQKTNTNQTSSRIELSSKEPESSSAPPIPNCNTVFGGPATGSHPESNSGAIAKDGTPCSTLQDRSLEASAKNSYLADAKDLPNTGEAETSATCSIKLPADEDLVNESCCNNQTPIIHVPSRRFTRSALKGKTDGPTYGRGKAFNEKSHSVSKLPLLNTESSLPKAVMAGAGPCNINVSSSCPKVDTTTVNIVSCTTDLSEDKTACVTPEPCSDDLYLQESKGPESLNILKASPSEPLKLQSNHDEIEVDISASKHTPVVKPSSFDLQASIPQIAGDITCSVSRENKKSEANDSSLHLRVIEVGNLVAEVNEEHKRDVPEVVSVSQASTDNFVGEKCTKTTCVEKMLAVEVDPDSVDKGGEYDAVGSEEREVEAIVFEEILNNDSERALSVPTGREHDAVGNEGREVEAIVSEEILNNDSERALSMSSGKKYNAVGNEGSKVEAIVSEETDKNDSERALGMFDDARHSLHSQLPMESECGLKMTCSIFDDVEGKNIDINIIREATPVSDHGTVKDSSLSPIDGPDLPSDLNDRCQMPSKDNCGKEEGTAMSKMKSNSNFSEEFSSQHNNRVEQVKDCDDSTLAHTVDNQMDAELMSKCTSEIDASNDEKLENTGPSTIETSKMVPDDGIGLVNLNSLISDGNLVEDGGSYCEISGKVEADITTLADLKEDLYGKDTLEGQQFVDLLQQSDDMKIGETDSNLKEIDHENEHQSVHILQQSDMNVGETGSDLEVTDHKNGNRLVDVLQHSYMNAGKTDSNVKGIDQENDITPVLDQVDVDVVNADNGESSRDNINAIDGIHSIDQESVAKMVPEEELQRKENANDAAPAKYLHGGDSVTITGEINDAAIDTIHIFAEEVDASKVLTEKLQSNEDALVAVPAMLHHSGESQTSTEKTNEVQGGSAVDTFHIFDLEVDPSGIRTEELQGIEDTMEAPAKLEHGGESLTSTEETIEAQGGSANGTVEIFDQEVDPSGVLTEELQWNEDTMEALRKLQLGGLTSKEKTNEAQGISANDSTHISDQEVDASNVELQRNEDAIEAPTKLQHGSSISTEETNEAQGISANDTTHISDQEVDATNVEFQRNKDAMESAPAKLQHGGVESPTSMEEANEAQGGSIVDTIHIFDQDVDASRVITEESERNEGAMETAPAKLQYGGESVTPPEEKIEAQGGSSANLIDISDCRRGELTFNIENLSTELKSFIRSDKVDGENSHLWSEDTNFMFDKSNNVEEQDILTGYLAEEHLHNSGEELVGEGVVEEREMFNDFHAGEHLRNSGEELVGERAVEEREMLNYFQAGENLHNTGEELFGEEYAELTENQHAASYNPNYRDDNNAVENSVATHNETHSETQANKGTDQKNVFDYTKVNEDITRADS